MENIIFKSAKPEDADILLKLDTPKVGLKNKHFYQNAVIRREQTDRQMCTLKGIEI
jgi:hypothetical protein